MQNSVANFLSTYTHLLSIYICACISYKNFSKSGCLLRDQTVHSAHCKRIPQQAKTRFVVQPIHRYFSLIFFAVLDSTNIYQKQFTTQNCSKNRQICGIGKNISRIWNRLWNLETNNETFVKLKWALRNPQLLAESANCILTPRIVRGIRILFADSN